MNVLDILIEKDRHHPDETVFIAKVALWEDEQFLCPVCGQKCDKYDRLKNIKRWRSLDLSKNRFYIECRTPRCICPEHGVLVHRILITPRLLKCVLLVRRHKCPQALCLKSIALNGIPLGTVYAEYKNPAKIKKIAIDETSYQVGHKYITVVQNLETNEVIWAHDGHGDEVLRLFFEGLTDEQLECGCRWSKVDNTQRNPQSGLTRLWELGRLDLSVEAHVIKPEYSALFTEDERRVCAERLESFGYKV